MRTARCMHTGTPSSRSAGNIAVAQVRALPASGKITCLDLVKMIVSRHRGFYRVVVQAPIVATKEAILHRPIARAQRGEAEFGLHILRDLKPAQALDLPLWR